MSGGLTQFVGKNKSLIFYWNAKSKYMIFQKSSISSYLLDAKLYEPTTKNIINQ